MNETAIDDGVLTTPLPQAKPRQRYFGPVSGLLAAGVVAAGGFYAGVKIEERNTPAPTAAAGRPNFSGPPPGVAAGGSPAAAAAAAPTRGTVQAIEGADLIIADSTGRTVRIKLSDATRVSQAAPVARIAIALGTTVVVQGALSADGSIVATDVSIAAGGTASGPPVSIPAGGTRPPGVAGPPPGIGGGSTPGG